tara:strand:- start:54 stop:668 length:615 start_codon:yes stop_codon:yes gene_type:complete
MNKNILALLLFFSLFAFDMNAQFIEIKKEKAVLVHKTEITQRIMPSIIEDSIVIKDANNNIRNLSTVTTSGEYSYSFKPLTVTLINSTQKNSSEGDIDSEEVLFSSSSINSKGDNKENLRIALIGTSKKVMLTDGSFFVKFKDNKDQNKFSQDYELEVNQELPDFTFYKLKNFNGMNKLINKINQDPRIGYIELNLIDPNITTN